MTKFLFTFFLFISGLLVRAQAPTTCPDSPTANDFSVAITKPVCEGDGEIVVSCTKDLTQWINVVYELHYPTGQVVKQGLPEFHTLSGHANDYVLIVFGACPLTDGAGQPQKVFRIEKRFKIGGSNRIPHQAKWISTTDQPTGSRPSFIDNTQSPIVDYRLGKLVFEVTTNLDPTRIRFKIEEAPTADLVGKIDTYTYKGVGNGTYRYTLDSTYPAGNYKVYVSDGCTEIPISFELDALYPPLLTAFELVYDAPKNAADAAAKGTDCQSFLLYNNRGTSLHNHKYNRYRYDNLLEYALVPVGTSPTTFQDAEQIHPIYWNSERNYTKVRVAHTYKDLYGQTLYEGYVRLKGTSLTAHSSIQVHTPPTFASNYGWDTKTPDCGVFYTQPLRSTSPWVSQMCMPYHYTVTEKSTGRVVYDNPAFYLDNNYDKIGPLNYNQTYVYRVVSSDGYTLEAERKEVATFSEDKRYKAHYMNGMHPTFQTNNHCGTKLRLRDKDGNVVHEQPMTAAKERLTYRIAYDTDYTVEHIAPDGITVLTQLPVRRTLLLPEQFPFTVQYPTLCHGTPPQSHIITNFAVNWQDLQYYKNPDYAFPVGTIITFTSDIPNFQERSITVPDADVQYVMAPVLSWPPGRYKATCNLGGTGTLKVYEFDFRGASELVRPLTLDIRQVCGGWEIKPDWEFSNGNHYGGPYSMCVIVDRDRNDVNWKEHTSIPAGTYTKFTKPGRYKAVLMGSAWIHDWRVCPWSEIEFDLIESRPKLVPRKTLAFMCSEGASETSVMIGIQGGSAPYTYELFKGENKQIQGAALHTTDNIADMQQMLWDVPFNPEYIVRVTDACGERAQFEFYPKPIDKIPFALVSADDNCEGEPLQVFTYEVPNSSYEWTHPDGTKSYDPVIDIPAADAARHAGTYHLKLTLTKCGQTINTSVNVKITPRLKNVELPDVDACPDRTVTFAVSHQDGRAPYTYRWDEYVEAEGKWVNRGHNSPTYPSNALSRKPIGATQMMRVTVTDACGNVVESRAATATVRQCYVPVNPQLMHHVK